MRTAGLIVLGLVLACGNKSADDNNKSAGAQGSVPMRKPAPTPAPAAPNAGSARPVSVTDEVVGEMEGKVLPAFEQIVVALESANKDCSKISASYAAQASNRKLITDFVATTLKDETTRQWVKETYRVQMQSLAVRAAPAVMACKDDEKALNAMGDFSWGLPF